ncbi:hypothetical protein EVAR_64980_1 [Eumeta japonica]|uniref:Uncharacterized protein n=1 Tax=Eumeta variegata TaxID=151549 RepID=A0A4C2A092_EUMVA|nr:hypothetical protein EVAR_64980_1 [Eumeta japonica]
MVNSLLAMGALVDALYSPGDKITVGYDPIQGHCQVGSLTGAVHLSNNNGGVPRPAQCGQKPHIEQKGKC